MEQFKKFISPEAWFSMCYPAEWNEFEDGEGSFLFYNPNEWTGNFRISAFKGHAKYASECVQEELKQNEAARLTTVGLWECAASQEMFEEEGAWYTTHLWVFGRGELVFECSFTVAKGTSVKQAEEVISSLMIREKGMKYPAEIIPVRLSEVYLINEAYEWVSHTVKEELKKDFQGLETDIVHMQQVVDNGVIPPKKKDQWLALGITLCVIMANEVDGFEWHTLVDGNREVPVLLNQSTGQWIDPMKLTWSRIKAGEKLSLAEAYTAALEQE